MIAFNKPYLAGKELEHIQTALSNGQLAGDGPFTKQCEEKITALVGCKSTLLTHSCTAALEMAAILLNLQEGDEVIMPSYTFVSTANAVVLRGAKPVFVDIREDTLNIDESKIEAAINERTKAIFVVHYAGVICEMDEIVRIAKNHDLIVVEDAAQALTSTYKGQAAGSFGDLSCFSFHETKNIISGEGGCLCINNESLIQRAEIIREKGTNRKNFFKGLVDKYTWVDLGSSYIPGELIASFLFGQLEKVNEIQSERLTYWGRYNKAFNSLSESSIRLPKIPVEVSHNAHLYHLIMPSPALRDELIQYLKEHEIVAPFHYVPLHLAPAGQKFCDTNGELTNTENLSARLIRLPLFPRLGDAQQKIIECITTFINERHL